MLLNIMLTNVGNRNPIFPEEFIPKDFVQDHLQKMKEFTTSQIGAIKTFIMFNRNSRRAQTHVSSLRRTASEFMRCYSISTIPQKYRVCQLNCKAKSLMEVQRTLNINDLALSVNDVNFFEDMSDAQRKEMLMEKVSKLSAKIRLGGQIMPILKSFKFDPNYGKPVENITRSMFVATIPFKIALLIEKQFKGPLLQLSKLYVGCGLDQHKINFEFLRNFGQSEKKFFRNVIKEFVQRKPNQIVFEKFYFITHFSVSVLAWLMSFYDECFVNDQGDIILRQYSSPNEIRLLEDVLDSERFDHIHCLVCPMDIHWTDFAVALIELNNFLFVSHIRTFAETL
ncbi:CMTR2.2 family protein [Megaselia abdita]